MTMTNSELLDLLHRTGGRIGPIPTKECVERSLLNCLISFLNRKHTGRDAQLRQDLACWLDELLAGKPGPIASGRTMKQHLFIALLLCNEKRVKKCDCGAYFLPKRSTKRLCPECLKKRGYLKKSKK